VDKGLSGWIILEGYPILMRNQKAIHSFCLDKFKIHRDDEFVQVEEADQDAVLAFNEGTTEGPETENDGPPESEGNDTPAVAVKCPNLADLHLDMKGSKNSLWNLEVARLIVEAFKAKNVPLGSLPDEDLTEMVKSKLERLRGYWKLADARVKEDGTHETAEDILDRLNQGNAKARNANRRGRRRSRVSISCMAQSNMANSAPRGISDASK
jgi:hypothetical protein